MILAGDIGGTKTILALFSGEDGVAGGATHEMRFESAKYDSLEAIIDEFLRATGARPAVASFDVAGPVADGHAKITNLPWIVDSASISARFSIPRVYLLNDLEATAIAVPHLGPDQVATLNPGAAAARGNIAVVAPGTGLGVGFLLWTGERYQACASEAGHTSFAPRNPQEIELLNYLSGAYGHVSFEHVCSGSAVPKLYAFLRQQGGYEEPDWLRQALEQAEDKTPVIIDTALAGTANICEATLGLFVRTLGTVAGNMAVSLLTKGGIYLGGGMPPRILKRLQQPDFLTAIADKGRFSDFLSSVPVHVILNPKVALHGAAWFGEEQLARG
jgi:glucokinase